jgi:hypothetical protein
MTSLGHHGAQAPGQKEAHLLLAVRGEGIDDAVDGLGGVGGVQGGEHQVAGFSGLQRGHHGFRVAHLAHQDDVGVLAQGLLEALEEGGRVGPHLPLGDVGAAIGVEVLDGVLDGDHVHPPVGVDEVDQGRQGGGLALARRARHQHQAVVEAGEIGQHRRQTQLFEAGHLAAQEAIGRGQAVALVKDVGPQACAVAGAGQVDGPLSAQLAAPRRGQAAQHQAAHLGLVEDLCADGHQLAVEAHRGRGAGLQVQVGGPVLDHHPEEVLEGVGQGNLGTRLFRRAARPTPGQAARGQPLFELVEPVSQDVDLGLEGGQPGQGTVRRHGPGLRGRGPGLL